MRFTPCYKQIGITYDRYKELEHFCKDYPNWMAEANSLLGIRATRNDGMPHGSGTSDPVVMAAERREKLLAKMAIVEECLRSIGDGKWYAAMYQHVCLGKKYEMIPKTIMPTSDSNTFYRQRRNFYDMLDKKKD